jgi:adenine-specific DNA-methyltransferase
MKNQKLELTWIGKDVQPKLEPRILIEDPDKSYGDRNAENMLIFGDNLLALKALEQDFTGMIKCIFIDPPYNTGSAFTHYDDGLEHSLWLTMMRDRLEILRRLLANDGSIWITIDDNEAHYLKVLCDEVFGRGNFVCNAVWQKKYTVSNDSKWLAENHDHVLVYALNKETWRPYRLGRSAEMNDRYRNPDNHPKGPWKATPLYAKRTGSEKEQAFSFKFKNGVVWTAPKGTSPRFPADALRKMDENDEIWFGNDGTATPSRKTFLCELKLSGPPSPTIWLHSDAGNNHEAREEVKAINPDDSFATPKPEKLLKRILDVATKPGDLVLDSFAGSGTTGAVAHKMGRKWIMVELGEHCHTHIIPRLKKVCDGTDQGGISKAVDWQGGCGFRYYYMAPSLLKKDRYGQWVINEEYNATMLAAAMAKHENFRYCPDEVYYWKQGQSSEKDFIFTTTVHLTPEHLDRIHEEMQPDESLLICCKSHFEDADGKYSNITVKKIPSMLLGKCEFDRDDYSLNIVDMPRNPDEPEFVPSGPPVVEVKKEEKKTKAEQSGQMNIFAGTED